MLWRPLSLLAAVSATAVVATQNPAFEVVSVKPQTELRQGTSRSGARYYEGSTTLRRVIEFAYDVPSVRIVGGPGWIDSELWAIDARAPAPATMDEMRLMVRQLLSDRFSFAAHVETRELPIYELHAAHRDGRLGPNARPAAGDCESIGVRSAEEVRAAGARPCGPGNPALGAGFVRVRFWGVPMSALASHLETPLMRVVTDRTGLSGRFDLDLAYASETRVSPPPSLAGLARQPDAPSLVVALEEQLGLKLEASTGPVDVLVIDSVERPMPD